MTYSVKCMSDFLGIKTEKTEKTVKNLKKLVIFDLDGTLVDSIEDLADSVNFALEKHSLPLNSLDDYYYFVGNGMEQLVRKALREKGGDDSLYRTVRADFDSYYEKHSNDKTAAYEGVPELLQKLNEKGIKTAVLSNKAQVYLRSILAKAFPKHEFSAELGQRKDIKRKPHPQALLMLMDELGYQKEDCVLVGDSDVDIITAANAGVDSIGVLWGFRTKEELISSGAVNLALNAEDLFEKILYL